MSNEHYLTRVTCRMFHDYNNTVKLGIVLNPEIRRNSDRAQCDLTDRDLSTESEEYFSVRILKIFFGGNTSLED